MVVQHAKQHSCVHSPRRFQLMMIAAHPAPQSAPQVLTCRATCPHRYAGSSLVCVLDVSKTSGIIELSQLPELLHLETAAAAATDTVPADAGRADKKKARKATGSAATAAPNGMPSGQLLVPGREMAGTVQFVKDYYALVALVAPKSPATKAPAPQGSDADGGRKRKKKDTSTASAAKAVTPETAEPQQLPDDSDSSHSFVGLGFLSRCDINTQGPAGRDARRLTRGQSLSVRIVSLPAESNGWRLLLEVGGCCFCLISLSLMPPTLPVILSLTVYIHPTTTTTTCPLLCRSIHHQQLAQPLQPITAKPQRLASAAKHLDGGLVSVTVVAVHDLEMEVTCSKVRLQTADLCNSAALHSIHTHTHTHIHACMCMHVPAPCIQHPPSRLTSSPAYDNCAAP